MRSVGEIVAAKYRVVRQIAEGGMGVLFEAVHISLDERVAIKFVRGSELGPDAIARFEREARLAVKLRTEHVARVLDAGRDEAGDPFIVMEYLEGIDLGHLLRGSGKVDPSLAADYLVQACHGLAEAHALTIVHRDVKPANLFLTEDAAGLPIIKVLDFGISKAVDGGGEELTASPERAAQLLGTPAYVSPEQLMTPHEVDARADIWSLGVCAWALATGKLPFTQSDLIMLFANILNNQAPSIATARQDLPPAFVHAIDRCLQRDRAGRFRDVGELARALGSLTSPRIRPLVEHTTLLLERGRARAAGTLVRTSGPSLTSEALEHAIRTERPPASSVTASFTPAVGPTGGAMVITHTMPVAPLLQPQSYRPPSLSPATSRSVPALVGVVAVSLAAVIMLLVGLRVFTPWLGRSAANMPAQASAPPLAAFDFPAPVVTAAPVVSVVPAPQVATTPVMTTAPAASVVPAAAAAPPPTATAVAAPAAPAPPAVSVAPKRLRPHPTGDGIPSTRE